MLAFIKKNSKNIKTSEIYIKKSIKGENNMIGSYKKYLLSIFPYIEYFRLERLEININYFTDVLKLILNILQMYLN